MVLVAGVLASLAVGAPGGATAGRWVIRELRPAGFPGGEAIAINNRGQIVGWAETKTGDQHAVLWTRQPAK